MRMFRAVFVFVLFVCNVVSAFQQPAPDPKTIANAYVYDELRNEYTFNTDGTLVAETTARVRVQSEAGVQALSILKFSYNNATQRLDTIDVKVTRADGTSVVTPAAAINEVTPQISREAAMYVDLREKHVPVSGLHVGDTLEYRAKTTTFEALIPGQFWDDFDFTKNAIVKREVLRISVPADRVIRLKHLVAPTISKAGNRTIYEWVTANEKIKQIEDALNRDKKKERSTRAGEPIDVRISTFTDFAALGNWYAGLQNPRAAATPEITAKAKELVAGVTVPEQQARRLYDFVNSEIRYISLSFGIGRYQPHTAQEVLANRYGDCKDKHTLLSALLKAAGIKSYPVLIHSQRDLDAEVPSPSQFDHLITAIDLNGKGPIIVDSTLGTMPFGPLLGGLRGRQAVLANAGSSTLIATPEKSALVGGQEFEIDGKFDTLGNLKAKVKITFTGDNAALTRSAFLRVPEENWTLLTQRIAYFLGYAGDVSNATVTNLRDTEKPFVLMYDYDRKKYLDRTNDSTTRTFPLPPSGLTDADDLVADSNHGLLLYGPVKIVSRATLTMAPGFKAQVPVPLKTTRDYGTYVSKYSTESNVVKAERQVEIPGWSIADSRESDYKAFRNIVVNDERQEFKVDFEPLSAANVPEGTKPSELNDAGLQALDDKRYSEAVLLFQRAVEADPKQPDAWNNLGRTYIEMGEAKQAETAIRKQIALNEFDPYAWNNLGRALEMQKRDDEAIAAYRKQIEINPLDEWAHKNLGTALSFKKEFAEAATELETALKIKPKDVEIKAKLASVYDALGQSKKARALFDDLDSQADQNKRNSIFDLIRVDGEPDQALESSHLLGRQLLKQMPEQLEEGEEPAQALVSAELISAAWAGEGWAHYQKGDLPKAELYLNAAWQLSYAGKIGHLLGQVYEKEGKDREAKEIYALALKTTLPEFESRKRLETLSGSKISADKLVAEAGPRMSVLRTVQITTAPVKFSSATFDLMFVGKTTPEQVMFRSGDEALKKYVPRMQAAKYPVTFPGGDINRLFRRGIMSCGVGGCAIVLMTPEMVASELMQTARRR